MILLLGPPGSGKSVQGKLLVKRNGWELLSTGALFRESEDPAILERLAKGELLDDELTNRVVRDALKDIPEDAEAILDGYPRKISQAEWLLKHATAKHQVEALVVLDVPIKELTKRLSARGRAEDSLDVMRHRINIYNNETSPVIDFYREHNTPIMVIDGLGSIEGVHERIQLAVITCLTTK